MADYAIPGECVLLSVRDAEISNSVKYSACRLKNMTLDAQSGEWKDGIFLRVLLELLHHAWISHYLISFIFFLKFLILFKLTWWHLSARWAIRFLFCCLLKNLDSTVYNYWCVACFARSTAQNKRNRKTCNQPEYEFVCTCVGNAVILDGHSDALALRLCSRFPPSYSAQSPEPNSGTCSFAEPLLTNSIYFFFFAFLFHVGP